MVHCFVFRHCFVRIRKLLKRIASMKGQYEALEKRRQLEVEVRGGSAPGDVVVGGGRRV